MNRLPSSAAAHGTAVAVLISLVALCWLWAMPAQAADAADSGLPHLQKQGTATQLIVDGRPWLMLAGEIRNSNGSSREYLAPVWPKLTALNLNTVLAAVSWELIEPEEGKFDFTNVDELLSAAREHHQKLVLLWFGGFKNAVCSYAPAWVRRDVERFPRVRRRDGVNQAVLSTLAKANWQADARAFAALLRHLRQVDGREHTVIMVQVENEAGMKNDARDRAAEADAAWSQAVPAALLEYMQKHQATLLPEFRKVWQAAGGKTTGTWGEVFGSDAAGEEVFSAWHMARYIEQVAAAGKAEYPLPMFVNAWLVQSEGQKPGEYPSGGPVARMHDVYRAAAPHIDVLAPDIYLGDFTGVCARYVRSGNPLLIPEASGDPGAGGRAFFAFGQHDAIGFSPYAIDDFDPTHPLGRQYARLAELLPTITAHQGTGQMCGVLEQGGDGDRQVDFGAYRANVMLKLHGKKGPGYGLIVKLADDEFLLAGFGFAVNFSATAPGPRRTTEFAEVWEGRFDAGRWVRQRRLNGDETGGGWRAQLPPSFNDPQAKAGEPSILRVKVFSHL